MNINRKIANRKNYGSKRSVSAIKYLVYHYTANDGDSDENNGKYFANNIVKASAHYFVDDDSITQSVDDNYVAYSVGGKKYPNTKGGAFYGKCTNTNSLSIELCDNVKNGVSDFTANTLNNAIALGQMLMKKYNIPISRVIRHYDVTGKICPKPFVENEKAWQNFKKCLQGENVDIDLDVPQKPMAPTTSKIAVDGSWGVATTKALQKLLCSTVDGIVSRQPISNKKYLEKAYTGSWRFTSNYKGGSAVIKALQRLIGTGADGYFGKNSVIALQKFLNARGFNAGRVDGYMGVNTVKALQRYINSR